MKNQYDQYDEPRPIAEDDTGRQYRMPNGDVVTHRVLPNGSHQIIVNGSQYPPSAYQHACAAYTPKGTYVAFTDYYCDDLPTEEPLMIVRGNPVRMGDGT